MPIPAMYQSEPEDIGLYARRLRTYSAQELEDVFYHVDSLHEPLRYGMVLQEMENRRLAAEPAPPPRRLPDLREWVAGQRRLAGHPGLRAVLLASLVCAATAGVTLAAFAPIWLCVVPMHLIGLQTALVYLPCAPIAPAIGAFVGVRMGGRGAYGAFVFLGVAAALALFDATGVPATILRVLAQPQGAGGGGFGFGL